MKLQNKFLRNLRIGFGISLLILIASSLLSYYSIYNLKKKAGLVNHTNIVLQQSEKVLSQLKDAETGQRGFLLTGSDFFLKPYFVATQNISGSLDSLQKLTSDNPKQQVHCDSLRVLISKRLDRLGKLIQTQRAGNLIDPLQLAEGQDVMDKTRDLIGQVQSDETQLLVQRTAALDYYNTFTPIIIIFGALIALAITVVFYRRVKKDY